MTVTQLINSILQANEQLSNPAWFLTSALALALIPVAFGLLTSYVKISIVLGIIKNALGTQHAPGAMVTLALSIALTGITMNPVFKESIEIAKTLDADLISKSPSIELLISLKPVITPWERFLRKNSGAREVMALAMSDIDSSQSIQMAAPKEQIESQSIVTPENADVLILIPAFLLTELKEGFSMAFIILLPFLAIDLIISNILMGLGMMMVSPVLISLPIKLILFVSSDAWLLIAKGLIKSYQL